VPCVRVPDESTVDVQAQIFNNVRSRKGVLLRDTGGQEDFLRVNVM
jgi:hypothetical protein